MQRKKKSDEKQPMKIRSTALKTRKTVEMDHVRRRLSSSSNNVSNMRLDGAMGIPLQVSLVGPPGSGSGSISQRYGSGSFCHHAKKVRKTSIPTVFLLLFYFLSLKNDVNVPSKSNKQKNFFLN
jgi:hypothetical protein